MTQRKIFSMHAPHIMLLTVVFRVFQTLKHVMDFLCEQKSNQLSTHERPAMPFGNRKKYLKGSFQYSIVTIQKISPPRKSKVSLFRHFRKLKIAYFNGKKILSIYLKPNFTPYTLGCYGLNCTSFSET